jgi:hypothetical protein
MYKNYTKGRVVFETIPLDNGFPYQETVVHVSNVIAVIEFRTGSTVHGYRIEWMDEVASLHHTQVLVDDLDQAFTRVVEVCQQIAKDRACPVKIYNDAFQNVLTGRMYTIEDPLSIFDNGGQVINADSKQLLSKPHLELLLGYTKQ